MAASAKGKLRDKWSGPFPVVKAFDNGATYVVSVHGVEKTCNVQRLLPLPSGFWQGPEVIELEMEDVASPPVVRKAVDLDYDVDDENLLYVKRSGKAVPYRGGSSPYIAVTASGKKSQATPYLFTPFESRTPDGPRSVEAGHDATTPVSVTTVGRYVVEAIEDERVMNRHAYLLVKWQDVDERTWELRDRMEADVPLLVQEFDAR